PAEAYPWPFAGHPMIPGRTACAAALDDDQRAAAAGPLARFLAALHAVPAAEAARHGAGPDTLARLDLARRLPWARASLDRLARQGPLADPPPLTATPAPAPAASAPPRPSSTPRRPRTPPARTPWSTATSTPATSSWAGTADSPASSTGATSTSATRPSTWRSRTPSSRRRPAGPSAGSTARSTRPP